MEGEKISVIVPVYKVEAYLHKCVDSILAQTYENLEVLLIDDGSPDGCPALCDGYAAQDCRVKVFHKENGGVSSARNLGLENATGDWIGFVDSDDWIEPDMYEALLERAAEESADLVRCGFFLHTAPDETACEREPDRRLSGEDAMRELLMGHNPQGVVWNKLYRRDMWDSVRFDSELARSEDCLAVYGVLKGTECYVICGRAYYHYRIREDGSTSIPFRAERFDMFYVAKRMLEGQKNNSSIAPYACHRLVTTAFMLIGDIVRNDACWEYFSMLRDEILRYQAEILRGTLFSLEDRTKLILLRASQGAYVRLLQYKNRAVKSGGSV